MSFVIGEQVGPYRISEQLGQGGMATVFKAYHAALDRYVAIKVLHVAFMEDPNFLARFQREARVVAKLEHPNIVPVYDFAEHEGRPYLVMKFIEGQTLKARLQQGGITPEEGIRIIEEVGAGLEYAHRQGILHRDIKPSNVMMAQDGGIFLADFGLARIAQAGESTMSSDMMLGTPQYISPEQAMGKRELDDGTDIYSFGVLIYELVVGKVPYSADTPFSIIHDHIYTPLPMPRVVNPNVPESVERVLLKALAKERADRFETVADLVEKFKRAVAGDEVDDLWLSQEAAVAAVSTSAVSQTLESPGAPPPAATAVSEPPEKKKGSWFKWWYVLPVVAALCICLFLFKSFQDNRPLANDNEPPPPAAQDTKEPLPPLPEDPTPPPPFDEPEVDEELEELIRRVEEDPENPYLRLDLAIAFLDRGMEEEASITFEEAVALAGDDFEFFMTAGNMLSDRGRERWLLALHMYIQAAVLHGEPVPPEWIENISRTLFMSAKFEEAMGVYDDISREEIDPVFVQMIDVARARFLFLHHEPDAAREMIDEILEVHPQFPIARLLNAEMLIRSGEVEEARAILQELSEQERVFGWIKMMARRLLDEIDS